MFKEHIYLTNLYILIKKIKILVKQWRENEAGVKGTKEAWGKKARRRGGGGGAKSKKAKKGGAKRKKPKFLCTIIKKFKIVGGWLPQFKNLKDALRC